MNVLCRLGLHRWRLSSALVGQSTASVRCARCAAIKVVPVDNGPAKR